MPLRLHGVTVAEAEGDGAVDGRAARIVTLRDLAAIVSDQEEFLAEPLTSDEVDAHRRIIEAAFQICPVVPAPIGTLFQDSDTLARWMELHYVTLSDALAFVEDRSAARVHIHRASGLLNADRHVPEEDRDSGSDLAAAAADAYRALRRQAVSALPLRLEPITGIVLSAAYLVERELWKEFTKAVEQQQRSHHSLRFECSGPWPAYDFVRMRFGE